MSESDSDVIWVNPLEIRDVSELNDWIAGASGDLVCICYPFIVERLERVFLESQLTNVHVVHAGLPLGGTEAFEELTAVSFNWNFLTPDSAHANFSWKATEHFLACKKETFHALGGFDPFFSCTGSVAEFCYRVMKAGGLVKYVPGIFSEAVKVEKAHVVRADVLRFAALHLSRNHAHLLGLYFLTRLKPTRLPNAKFESSLGLNTLSGIIHEKPVKVVGDYTAIIPTILRYDYIGKSIESLLAYDYPPTEIIVVDQTPVALRKPATYDIYIQKGLLRVFYMDEPGQCTSRNLAIAEAKTEWLLFFEDDTEAWPTMMLEHKFLMEHSLADVSTGVSLAPWKDERYIPERLRKYHVSDVLATGNCFMKRETALSVNGLHMAFNRGSGADDDFGRRLFLAGMLIIFNYKAIQTHHKAPSGGMRVHGAWWRTTSRLLGAYPPPTQSFMIRNYYLRKFRIFQFVLFYIQAKKATGFFMYFLQLIFSPVKIYRSIRASSQLLQVSGKR